MLGGMRRGRPPRRAHAIVATFRPSGDLENACAIQNWRRTAPSHLTTARRPSEAAITRRFGSRHASRSSVKRLLPAFPPLRA